MSSEDDRLELDPPQSVFYRGRRVKRTKCFSFNKTEVTQRRLDRERCRKQPKRRAK
jgi:hypothetical protein